MKVKDSLIAMALVQAAAKRMDADDVDSATLKLASKVVNTAKKSERADEKAEEAAKLAARPQRLKDLEAHLSAVEKANRAARAAWRKTAAPSCAEPDTGRSSWYKTFGEQEVA